MYLSYGPIGRIDNIERDIIVLMASRITTSCTSIAWQICLDQFHFFILYLELLLGHLISLLAEAFSHCEDNLEKISSSGMWYASSQLMIIQLLLSIKSLVFIFCIILDGDDWLKFDIQAFVQSKVYRTSIRQEEKTWTYCNIFWLFWLLILIIYLQICRFWGYKWLYDY